MGICHITGGHHVAHGYPGTEVSNRPTQKGDVGDTTASDAVSDVLQGYTCHHIGAQMTHNRRQEISGPLFPDREDQPRRKTHQ